MAFVGIDLSESDAKRVSAQLGQRVRGVGWLTDGSKETIQEALKYLETLDAPVKVEDLLVRAVEGKLVGQAICW